MTRFWSNAPNLPGEFGTVPVLAWSGTSSRSAVDQEAAIRNGKRNIGVILVTEATVPAKDIRDGIGISFNPRFRAVGRDSIYGVIRVCTTIPLLSSRGVSPLSRSAHQRGEPNMTQPFCILSLYYVFHAHPNGLPIGKGRNGIPGIVRGFGYGYTFLHPQFATSSSSSSSVRRGGEFRKRSPSRNECPRSTNRTGNLCKNNPEYSPLIGSFRPVNTFRIHFFRRQGWGARIISFRKWRFKRFDNFKVPFLLWIFFRESFNRISSSLIWIRL